MKSSYFMNYFREIPSDECYTKLSEILRSLKKLCFLNMSKGCIFLWKITRYANTFFCLIRVTHLSDGIKNQEFIKLVSSLRKNKNITNLSLNFK